MVHDVDKAQHSSSASSRQATSTDSKATSVYLALPSTQSIWTSCANTCTAPWTCSCLGENSDINDIAVLWRPGLTARRPYVGPVLSAHHRQQRLHWAQRHLHMTRRGWRAVLFSDESRFSLSMADGRIRVWRRARQRYKADAAALWCGEHSAVVTEHLCTSFDRMWLDCCTGMRSCSLLLFLSFRSMLMLCHFSTTTQGLTRHGLLLSFCSRTTLLWCHGHLFLPIWLRLSMPGTNLEEGYEQDNGQTICKILKKHFIVNGLRFLRRSSKDSWTPCGEDPMLAWMLEGDIRATEDVRKCFDQLWLLSIKSPVWIQ